MLVIRFTIPGTPIPLQRARLGNGHFYTPEASVKYQEKVRRVAALAGCPVFAKGCEVELAIYLPDKRRRDRDNIEKGIMDALQPKRATKKEPARRAIAWNDDHDVGDVKRHWEVDRERPRVEVTIRGERAPESEIKPAMTRARPSYRKPWELTVFPRRPR